MNEDPLKQNGGLNTPLDTPEEPGDTPSLAPDPAPQVAAESSTKPLSSAESPVTETTETPVALPNKQTQDELLLTAHAAPDVLPPQKRSVWLMALVIIVAGLIVAAGLAYLAYHIGNSRGYKNGQKAQAASTALAELKVPEHATMVAQCAEGEGTQYVLPSNIPQGPIYNVWNNKVTGIEFMLSQSQIAASKTLDLSLMSQKYNHIDVMYEAAGHAGFTEPHYHIILSLIPYSQEQKITCSGSSSSSMSSMGM